jgi:hypothetical protein
VIIPTVGRNVHLRRVGDPSDAQPNLAFIVYVHNDRLVNIVYFDAEGVHRAAKRVLLLQGDEDDAKGKDSATYWVEWMPWQKGQASKTDAAEKVAKQVRVS